MEVYLINHIPARWKHLFIHEGSSYWYSNRLIDDSDDVQTGDGSCIFGGLALGIIEISGHSDHSMCDL